MAALNGAATGTASVLTTQDHKIGSGTLATAGVGALFGVLAYLKQPATGGK